MNPTQHTYIAIDLKSFFASVECVERGLDPLTTNLVVADASRTEKTICLAVTPFAEGIRHRWPCPSVRGGAAGAGGEPAALAPQLCALPVRKVQQCPGAGTASRLGGGLHRGSAPDGLLHRIQPADL